VHFGPLLIKAILGEIERSDPEDHALGHDAQPSW
jgi:hypothetical protein